MIKKIEATLANHNNNHCYTITNNRNYNENLTLKK